MPRRNVNAGRSEEMRSLLAKAEAPMRLEDFGLGYSNSDVAAIESARLGTAHARARGRA